MLLPRTGRLAARGLVTGRLGLYRRREAWLRRGFGVLLATGAPQALWSRRGQVVPTNRCGDIGDLVRCMRETWTADVAALGFSVRQVTPNYKPTFVAVDARGRLLGFGKLGADVATRARLEQEVTALAELAEAPVPGLRTPHVLADFDWQDRRIIIVDPIPVSARRFSTRGVSPAPLVEHALASGQRRPVLAYARDLCRSTRSVADGELADAASSLVAAMQTTYGGATTPSGRAHGDWVPWNVATCFDELWAWDWEHSRADDPVIVDIAHWHLQVQRWALGRPLLTAYESAAALAAADCRRAGLQYDEIGAALALSRLAVASRTAELAHTSGLWRPGVHEQLIALLRLPVGGQEARQRAR